MKKDKTFILTKDPYDDFEILGTFKALKDFDFDEEQEKFLNDSDRDDTYLDPIKFIEYLELQKLITKVPQEIVHLGNYGDGDFLQSQS